MWRPCRASRRGQAGSAVVDTVLVGTLVLLLVGGLVQLTLVQHVRAVVVDAAGHGARVAAVAGSDDAAGAERTRELIAAALSPDYAEQVEVGRVRRDGLDLVEVRVVAPVPVVGLLGPGGGLTVTGHAVVEQP